MLASYTSPATVHFRDQLVAAPLKHRKLAVGRVARARDFRDQLVAAPLKHGLFPSMVLPISNFRDQLVAAPLKHDPARQRDGRRAISATNWSRPH